MASNVLEEFLVNIIWKEDEASQKKALENVAKLEKGLVSLAAAATAATIGIVAAMSRVATSFEDAFYQSSRAGGTINELKAVQFAAAQTGASAQAAGASINSLMDKIRASGGNNGGFAHLIKQLTGDQSNDWIKQYSELLTKLHNMRPEQAAGYANVLGISAEEYLSDPADRIRQMEEFAAKAKALGIDLEKAGRDGKEFAREYRDLGNTIGLIGDKVISKLLDDPDKPLQKLSKYLTEHGAQIADILERIGKAFIVLFDKMIEALPTIDQFVEKHGGWEAALTAIGALLLVKVVPGLTAALGLLKKMSLLLMGTPLGRLLLLGGAAYMGAESSLAPGGSPPLGTNDPYGEGGLEGPAATGEAVRGWWRRHAPTWLGGGKKGAEESGVGSVAPTTGAGSLTGLIHKAALEAAGGDEAKGREIERHMEGIRAGESGHRADYDKKDDAIESSWGPFQLNRRSGLGVEFERDTAEERKRLGLGDLRDPRTIPLQAAWVAKYISQGRSLRPWAGYHGPRDADPRWGNSGYEAPSSAPSDQAAAKRNGDAASAASAEAPIVARHNGGPVPMPKGWPPKPSTNPFGGFDPDAMRPLFAPPALGTAPEAAKNITIHQNNTNHVSGVSDPTAAAGQIGAKQDRHSSMLLRNLQSAIV